MPAGKKEEGEPRAKKPGRGLEGWLQGKAVVRTVPKPGSVQEEPAQDDGYEPSPLLEPEEEPRPTDWMPEGQNELDALRRRYAGLAPQEAEEADGESGDEPGGDEEPKEEPVCYSSFMLDGTEPNDELKRFLNEQQRVACAIRLRLEKEESAPVRDPGGEEPQGEAPKKEVQNAACELMVTRDAMTAWAFLYPPGEGGGMLDSEGLHALLAQKEITYGVDEEMLARLAREAPYFKLAPVAHGLPKVDGENGRIIDHVPRDRSISVKLNDDGTADYKNLNWLHSIKAGDVICEVVPPTEPVPGCSVRGRQVDGKRGLKAHVPKGKGTELNAEGTALMASEDGQISFSDGKFNIDRLTTIPRNVDVATGNIEVLGDVVIYGDILEGFLVKATGNVVVRGMIEGATVIAGGNIQICNGMNGNGHGTLDAQGDISSKFLENCVAQCEGSIYSESIVNSRVTSNGVVDVTTGRGVIIGGLVMACQSVRANIIGNRSHRNTTIVIGSTPSFLQQKDRLAAEVERMEKEIDELAKNVDYLNRTQRPGEQPRALYSKMKLQLSVQRMQHAKKKKELEELEARKADLSQCHVTAGEIYPLTQITIGREPMIISSLTRQCRIYKGPKGVTIGLK